MNSGGGRQEQDANKMQRPDKEEHGDFYTDVKEGINTNSWERQQVAEVELITRGRNTETTWGRHTKEHNPLRVLF